MARTTFFSSFSLAHFFSLGSSLSSSEQKTTKLPILHLLFFAVQASIFLMSLVSLSLVVRAKIIATGLLPFSQYRQCFLPACLPSEERPTGLRA